MNATSRNPLAARLQRGDRDAFRETYDRYKRDLLALASTMLGQEDHAWDVLHDVFLSLARNAPRLSPESNLRGYLMTAAANRARDILAKRLRGTVAVAAAAHSRRKESADPHALAEAGEEASDLRKTLLSLSEDQRTVVALRIYAGMSFREIADRCAIPENTAQSRYRYALERLRQRFMKEAKDGSA